MTLLNALYTLLLMPLQVLFELIYSLAYEVIGNPGWSIIALSLAINLLVLPLYRRADAMQEEERQINEKLTPGISHIKKTFSGDERTMMLQTYYRQNDYSPTRVFRGSISLFLQIPFFIAAYRFLSGLQLLNGVAFGPIADLSQPDALLQLGGMTVNLLPFFMTGINVISTICFTKGHPLKSKIQLYAMAAFFLIFLYDSPAGLVFYWTLNNLFSLVKTLVYKLKNPKLVLSLSAFFCGCISFCIGVQTYPIYGSKKRLAFFIAVGVLLLLPLIIRTFKEKWAFKKKPSVLNRHGKPDQKLFLCCGIFLSVFIGLLIPSAVIKASPQEFVDLTAFVHPVWYIVSALLLSVGTFVIWLGVFYRLCSSKTKVFFDCGMVVFCGAAVCNYFLFGKNLGTLSADLKYLSGMNFSSSTKIINLALIAVLLILCVFLYQKWRRKLRPIFLILTIAVCCMAGLNHIDIFASVAQVDTVTENAETATPTFTLSKTGKNVVVIMLDRAMGEYVPYIFNEKPELIEKFSGFTYYNNVVSYGTATNFASPALFGGYEYTPTALNTRSDESLESKHNEALKVLPVLFDEAGYDVTVCDPTYAGYQWIPDLSVYDDYSNIKTYNTNGYFTEGVDKEQRTTDRFRNFFSFAITKTTPVILQSLLYEDGRYNNSKYLSYSSGNDSGTYSSFLAAYNVLQNLSTMTRLSDSEQGGFLMLSNDLTHNPCLLQEPDYTPALSVDNTEFDQNHSERFKFNGITLKMESDMDYAQYQTNMAAYLMLANWFDDLRAQGVYDNTRIILVADHGYLVNQMAELMNGDIKGYDGVFDEELYFPLLMVKDFDSTVFQISDEFMTNADVPALSVDRLLEKTINPFTGNDLLQFGKNNGADLFYSFDNDITENNGNTFFPGSWVHVQDSIWNKQNWTWMKDNGVLPN